MMLAALLAEIPKVESGAGPGAAWVAAATGIVILLLQLFRFLESFASKKDVTDKTAASKAEVTAAHKRIEDTVAEHRKEATALVETATRTIAGKVDDVLNEVREVSTRVRGLEDWQIAHESEDKAAHGQIAEVRDLLEERAAKKVPIYPGTPLKRRGAYAKKKAGIR